MTPRRESICSGEEVLVLMPILDAISSTDGYTSHIKAGIDFHLVQLREDLRQEMFHIRLNVPEFIEELQGVFREHLGSRNLNVELAHRHLQGAVEYRRYACTSYPGLWPKEHTHSEEWVNVQMKSRGNRLMSKPEENQRMLLSLIAITPFGIELIDY